MKRYVLLLGVLLCCFMLKAQSVTYTCRYWFDQNYEQAVTASFSDILWQAEIDVGLLSEGFHKFHLQIADTAMNWSSPQTYLFFKIADNLQEDLTCRYWFDQNHVQMQQLPLGDGILLLNVSDLEEGLHTINVLLEGDALTSTTCYMFMKVPVGNPSTEYQYHCWFDQDFEHRQSDTLGDGQFLLDVSELEEGLHTVNVLLEGDALTTTTRYVFMKVPVGNPFAEYQYRCWFDNDVNNMQTGWLGSGCFQLEVDQLAIGFHIVNVQLDDNGTLSAPQRYMFYKRPFGGCITKWEYWLNGDFSNKHTTDLSPFVDTLDIISLLPVETWSVRSTCFHFQPNGEEPYLNAKNEITFRFWDVDKHFIDKSSFYIDENVVEPIVADTLERNTTVSIDAPRDNQIHWFKLEASRGDYLSFQADKACMMQLFAPSGEEVYAASGPESIVLEGFNVWEDGTYYLAVHDVTGSGEEVSITYNWLNRYAIASYNVHLVGNGGCSTITFQGNGFNSLLDAYLVNYQNDTIRQLDIGHESNTTTTISFNFYEENLGVYDAVFQFFEEAIRINGALEVQEPVDILLTTTVSYPSVFLINTPCTYTYTVTNNGNMSAYAVPIYMYVSSQTKDGISHLEIDGLDLPSVIDDIDLDSLSASDRLWLQEWADEIGEDHYFMKVNAIDEETGNSIYVRTNFFFMTLAPFETKTIAIKVTADEPINVFVTAPNDRILPLVLSPEGAFRGGNRGWYCCMQEQIQCTLNLICSSISIASIVPAWAAPLAVADCICGIINEINDVYSSVFCDGNSNLSYWERFKNMKKAVSVTGTVVACIKKNNPIGKIKEILDAIDAVVNGLTLGDITHDVSDCIEKWKRVNPNCNPGSPSGGGAGPVYSLDPNDIHGYLSESGSHYMRQEIQNVQYEIEFENDTTLATAAAHTIIVRDTLDATKFDLNSLAARSVTIGDKRLDLNGERTFARTLDLRPDIYVIAQVNQDYDPTTGIIQWTIQSLDPMTMEPTDDPNQGVLPVNYYGNGVGFIDYSIDIKEAFADGTEISNRASIVFDQEEQILTPTWTNIVDAVKPTSHIENVNVDSDTLCFNFVSEDNRSGIWYHTLYYRNESTEQQWKVLKNQIIEDNYQLILENQLFTDYLVMATDSAGNHEDKELISEFSYGMHEHIQSQVLSPGWNWYSSYVEYDANSLPTMENRIAASASSSMIKSQHNGFVSFENNMWNGDLAGLANEQMYLVRVNQGAEVTMTGQRAKPQQHPITLAPGWNWIGFLSPNVMDLEEALASLSPQENDMIKSQWSYSSYSPETGWTGSLDVLVPGQGYLYWNRGTANTVLVYPGSARDVAEETGEERHWTNDPHRFPTNLTMMVTLDANEFRLEEDRYEIGAFVNGECRGSARLQHIASIGQHIAFLTVTGEEGEEVAFHLFDAASDETRILIADEHIAYHADAVHGTLKAPMPLHFSNNGIHGYHEVGLYPNPTTGKVTVKASGMRGITVTDVLGQVVYEALMNDAELTLDLSKYEPGLYMVHVDLDNGSVVKKVVMTK